MEKIEIKFELTEVKNNFLLHLKDITECITHIYQAIEESDRIVRKPLPTDSFPILISDNRPMSSVIEQKQLTLQWVLTKAFEEFINGLTKSFKEAYKYLEFYQLSKENLETWTREKFDTEVQKIEANVEKLHFPEFILRIEKMLNQTLPLKEEILSINQIRNCLVHRHGFVGQKDLKNSSVSNLQLKWLSLKSWGKLNGEEIEITYELRKDGIILDNISFQTIKNEKTFEIGDKISLDINEFNGIAYTCISFIDNLFLLLPRPNDFEKN